MSSKLSQQCRVDNVFFVMHVVLLNCTIFKHFLYHVQDEPLAGLKKKAWKEIQQNQARKKRMTKSH